MIALLLLMAAALAQTTWQQPPAEVLDVLRAPALPTSWPAPGGAVVLMANRDRYPPLATRAAPMLRLAGLRIDARSGGLHSAETWSAPTLLRVADGSQTPLPVQDPILDARWSADGRRLALVTNLGDHIGLWVGGDDGRGDPVAGLSVNPLLGHAISWLPDQQRLLVKTRPADRGNPPEPPLVPDGPMVQASEGGVATSTYEARDVLRSSADERLFEWHAHSELTVVDARDGARATLGASDLYADVQPSPDGRYLLVERLRGPWSHRHGWGRFGATVDVWNADGTPLAHLHDRPLADRVPIHGVPEGPRSLSWRPGARSSLVWFEALDGGDWSRDVPHRDRLMELAAPFDQPAREVVRLQHRQAGLWWSAGARQALVEQFERARRWRHLGVLDARKGQLRPLIDLSANDHYGDPGAPLSRLLGDGSRVLEEVGDAVLFEGRGGSPQGDRPFVDAIDLRTGRSERLFRATVDRYERLLAVVDARRGLYLIRSESPTDPPDTVLVTLGGRTQAPAGEAARVRSERALTQTADPSPALRQISRRIVTYARNDGVPLSFVLYLPPQTQPGTALPTLVYAYPREYSDAGTAGQVRGSDQTFEELTGASHLFFALQGYAVLHNTQMPVLGDPDTAYDTFVPQLVAGAAAAIDAAVQLGVADRDRVGIMGHSHGGLMAMTLLAHSDLFRAGIARSGAYNHTIRPYGFQSERRTLWEAAATYTGLSPVMFAPQVNEPALIIHGEIDENPGTIPFQSRLLFEALQGAGATVRQVELPYEGHAYRARESVEHVLWEQSAWFEQYVKGAAPRP